MTVHGSLTSLPLSDALQWLSQGGKTGALKLVTPEGRSTILFTKGSIVGVELALPDLLSDLTRQGLADEESIRSVLATMESGSWSQKRILGALGLAESEIDTAMANTSERAIIGLLSSTEGTFIFEPAPGEEAERTERAGRNHSPLAVQRLLLTGAQQIDESRRAQAELARLSPQPPTDPEPITPSEVAALDHQADSGTNLATPEAANEPQEVKEETLPGIDLFEVDEALPPIAHIDDFRAPITAPSSPTASPATVSASLAASAELAPTFSAPAEPEAMEFVQTDSEPSEDGKLDLESTSVLPQLAEEDGFTDPTLSAPSPPTSVWTSRNGMLAAAVAVVVLVAGTLLWRSGILSSDPEAPALAASNNTTEGSALTGTAAGGVETPAESDLPNTAAGTDTVLASEISEESASAPSAAQATVAQVSAENQQAEAAALDRRVEQLVASRTADIEANLRSEYSAELEKLRQDTPPTQPQPETTQQASAETSQLAQPDQLAAGTPAEQPPPVEEFDRATSTPSAAETVTASAAENAVIPTGDVPGTSTEQTATTTGTAAVEAPLQAVVQEVPEQTIVTTPIAVTLPSLLSHPPPRYSNQMRQVGREVTVIVKVVVDATGSVTEAELPNKKQGFGFDSMALWMARNSSWKPGTSGGDATQMRAEMRVVFRP